MVRTSYSDLPLTRFDSWMFRIVQTVWFNELASRKRRPEEPFEGLEGRVGEDGVRHTEARLSLAEVQRAFAGLPGEQRVVLLLVCVEGYTYKEAAETLGIPVGTVMSRVARGRLALFDILQAGSNLSTDNIVHLG